MWNQVQYLKFHTFGISHMFVYRDKYNEKSFVCVRKRSGLPRSVRTKKAIKAVKERIQTNPVRKQKVLSREITILPRSMSHILVWSRVWSFQQDSAPGHKARSNQSWLETKVLEQMKHEMKAITIITNPTRNVRISFYNCLIHFLTLIPGGEKIKH